jgi:hypothetical protein
MVGGSADELFLGCNPSQKNFDAAMSSNRTKRMGAML